VRRRRFITLLGGAAAAWPLAARAQQPAERMRRIGVLMAVTEDDVDMQTRLAGFRQGLERRGWSDGRNVRIDYRFAGGHADRFQVRVIRVYDVNDDKLANGRTFITAEPDGTPDGFRCDVDGNLTSHAGKLKISELCLAAFAAACTINGNARRSSAG
jgi:hypothetical protein